MFILPSRSRPHNIARLVIAWRATNATSPLVLRLDLNDPRLPEYLEIKMPPHWFVRIGSPNFVGPLTNEVFKEWPNSDWYGILGDDVVPLTYEWDRKLSEACGSNAIAYGNDTIHGRNLCTHPVIGGELVREMGFITLPGLKGLYGDTVWMHIGQTRDCLKYLDNVILEHRHWSNGKAPMDASYASHTRYAEDQGVYERWRSQWQPKAIF